MRDSRDFQNDCPWCLSCDCNDPGVRTRGYRSYRLMLVCVGGGMRFVFCLDLETGPGHCAFTLMVHGSQLFDFQQETVTN